MMTAKDAWNEANERYEDFLQVVEDAIKDGCARGNTSVTIEFKYTVSSTIIDKIKEELYQYGYSITTKDATEEAFAIEISWEVEE